MTEELKILAPSRLMDLAAMTEADFALMRDLEKESRKRRWLHSAIEMGYSREAAGKIAEDLVKDPFVRRSDMNRAVWREKERCLNIATEHDERALRSADQCHPTNRQAALGASNMARAIWNDISTGYQPKAESADTRTGQEVTA